MLTFANGRQAAMRSPDNAQWAIERQLLILDAERDSAFRVGLDVSEIADMPVLVGRSAVSLIEGVEVRARRHATIAKIAESAVKRRLAIRRGCCHI